MKEELIADAQLLEQSLQTAGAALARIQGAVAEVRRDEYVRTGRRDMDSSTAMPRMLEIVAGRVLALGFSQVPPPGPVSATWLQTFAADVERFVVEP
jgi:hypothetical protein